MLLIAASARADERSIADFRTALARPIQKPDDLNWLLQHTLPANLDESSYRQTVTDVETALNRLYTSNQLLPALHLLVERWKTLEAESNESTALTRESLRLLFGAEIETNAAGQRTLKLARATWIEGLTSQTPLALSQWLAREGLDRVWCGMLDVQFERRAGHFDRHLEFTDGFSFASADLQSPLTTVRLDLGDTPAVLTVPTGELLGDLTLGLFMTGTMSSHARLFNDTDFAETLTSELSSLGALIAKRRHLRRRSATMPGLLEAYRTLPKPDAFALIALARLSAISNTDPRRLTQLLLIAAYAYKEQAELEIPDTLALKALVRALDRLGVALNEPELECVLIVSERLARGDAALMRALIRVTARASSPTRFDRLRASLEVSVAQLSRGDISAAENVRTALTALISGSRMNADDLAELLAVTVNRSQVLPVVAETLANHPSFPGRLAIFLGEIFARARDANVNEIVIQTFAQIPSSTMASVLREPLAAFEDAIASRGAAARARLVRDQRERLARVLLRLDASREPVLARLIAPLRAAETANGRTGRFAARVLQAAVVEIPAVQAPLADVRGLEGEVEALPPTLQALNYAAHLARAVASGSAEASAQAAAEARVELQAGAGAAARHALSARLDADAASANDDLALTAVLFALHNYEHDLLTDAIVRAASTRLARANRPDASAEDHAAAREIMFYTPDLTPSDFGQYVASCRDMVLAAKGERH